MIRYIKMKRELSRNLSLLNVFSFMRFFAFWQPIEQLYLYSIGGNEAVLGIGLALWTISQFIWEVPSGYISDRFGKKKVFYLAQIARIAGFLIIALPQTITSYYIGIFLFGTAMAFISGSDRALLHDTLAELKQQHKYKKLAGKMGGLSILGMMISGFLALGVAKLGYRYGYLLSIIPQLLLIIVVRLMYEPKSHSKELLHNPAADMLKAIRSSLGTRALQLLLVLAATAEMLKRINMDYGQAFLASIFGAATLVSFIWVLGGASRALSNFVAHRVEDHTWLLVLVAFGLFFGMSFGPTTLAPILYVLLFLPINIVILQAEEAVQKVAPNHLRATTLSGMNMFITLLETGPLMLLGFYLAGEGVRDGFRLSALVLIVTISLLFAGFRFTKHKPPKLGVPANKVS